MIEQAVSLWRRLTGQPDSAMASASLDDDDRRLWVRYPTNVQTYYEPTNGRASEGRLSARISNISMAGIKLVVDRAFSPGSMLTVELPAGDDERRSVLACVVHSQKVGEDAWALGCSFARELAEDDLDSFHALRKKRTSGDNRQWERYACNVKAVCQVVSTTDLTKWPATVLNISVNGMALQVNRDIPTGAMLTADLEGGTTKAAKTILACVVHVLTQTSGERVLGCNFIRELSEADLGALV